MIDLNLNEVQPLPDQLEKLRANIKDQRKRFLRDLRNEQKERAQTLRKNRVAAQKLVKAGFKLQMSEYDIPMERIYVDVGEANDDISRSRIERDKLTIARLLRSHLEEDFKELLDGKSKKVRVGLHVAKTPGIKIRYVDIISDDGKCRIVKEVVKSKRRTDYRLECQI